MTKILQRILVCLLLLAAIGSLGACTPGNIATPAPELPVDALFKEFYASVGGRVALGPVTCALFDYQKDGQMLKCQYTSNALMCNNPFAADDASRFFLYPLGRALNLQDIPDAPNGAAEGQRVVDGFILYPAFVQRYDAMKGAQTTGQALTRARYNYLQRRIEQYFENVGFFQSLDDSSGRVCLLAYGSYTCRESCQVPPADPCLGLIDPDQEQVEQPFLESLVTNDLLVIGQPISRLYNGADGLPQQVYESALVASNGGELHLLPLPLMLGMPSDEPGSPTGTSTSQYIFYPARDPLGFYVLVDFDRFIQAHGGMRLSGAPISNVRTLEHGVLRQCFENYCLEYFPTAAQDMRVRMSPLGIQYLQSGAMDASLVVAPLYSAETISLQSSAAQASLKGNQPQTFYIQINDRQKGSPLAGVSAGLRLVLPDTQEMYFDFPPTDANGKAELVVEPLPNMENGGIIPYHVCLNLSSPLPICVSKTYMVWNYR